MRISSAQINGDDDDDICGGAGSSSSSSRNNKASNMTSRGDDAKQRRHQPGPFFKTRIQLGGDATDLVSRLSINQTSSSSSSPSPSPSPSSSSSRDDEPTDEEAELQRQEQQVTAATTSGWNGASRPVDKNLVSSNTYNTRVLINSTGQMTLETNQKQQLETHKLRTNYSKSLAMDTDEGNKMILMAQHQHQHQQQLTKKHAPHLAAPAPPPPPAKMVPPRVRVKQFLIVVLFLIGLIVCVTSIICILLLPTFITNQISRKLVLKNNSLLMDRWSKPSVPMYFKVWLFDVKNARELIDIKGTKAQLEEIGPFVFNLRRQKDVISFAGDNLYYTERKVYHFNRELSCCAINTTVTIPNIPLVAVVDRAMGYNLPLLSRFVPRLINRAIQSLREQLFVRKQVGEILFDGYEVELLKMVSRIGSIVGLPQQNQRFALLKGRNNTWRPEQDGVFAINTGQRDRRKFGKVSSWNSYKQLPFWSGAKCNAINGSDGTLFPPPISNKEPLYIFNQELCRTVNLIYQRPSEIHSIPAYRFGLNPLNFAHTMAPQPIAPAAPAGLAPPPPVAGGQQRAGAPTPGGRRASSAAAPINTRPSRQAAAAAAAAPPPPPALVAAPVVNGMASLQPGRVEQHQANGHQHNQQRKTKEQQLEREMQAKQEKFVQVAQVASENWTSETRRNPQTCFCDRKSTKLGQTNVCEFDGLIDLSKCSKQAQVVFGSMPHFHEGDLRLLKQVDGLNPNASKHATYLDIEPNTGLVLGGKRRVQLNLLIKHNDEVDGFQNINDMLVPLVWFEESAQITEELAKKFKSSYTERIRLIYLALVSLFCASLILLLIDARLMMANRYWRRFVLLSSTVGVGAEKNSPGGGVSARLANQQLHATAAANYNDESANTKTMTQFTGFPHHHLNTTSDTGGAGARHPRGADYRLTTAAYRRTRRGTMDDDDQCSSCSLSSSSSCEGAASSLYAPLSGRRIAAGGGGGGGSASLTETDGDNSAKQSDSPLLELTNTDTEMSPAGSPIVSARKR